MPALHPLPGQATPQPLPLGSAPAQTQTADAGTRPTVEADLAMSMSMPIAQEMQWTQCPWVPRRGHFEPTRALLRRQHYQHFPHSQHHPLVIGAMLPRRDHPGQWCRRMAVVARVSTSAVAPRQSTPRRPRHLRRCCMNGSADEWIHCCSVIRERCGQG